MTELLLRVFVKNYKETDDPKVREACGKFAGIVGIVSNIILCLMKVIVGMFAGSIAIIADGINNLADASSSVITFIGFKLSSLPEDKEHPYGHARYEYLTGLLVSVLIIVVGVQLLRSSFDKVLNPEETVFSLVTVLVLVIAIVMKVWQAVFNIGLGKRINSMTLIATGTDSRNDVISTTVVLIALIITKITGFQLDGIMGCAVALFIIWSGITLVRDTVSPLLGEAPDEELVREIERRTWQFEGVLGIHDLIVHNYGPGKVFASMHVEIDACGDMMEAHDMIDNIERSISEALKIHIVIHMDPVITNDPELNHLKEVVSNVAALIPGVSNIHDFRMVKGPTHTNVIFDAIVCDNCKLDEDEIKNIIETELRKENPDYFVVITFDKAYVDIDPFK
ncbi:MAG: cation transporter [Firmicutes bacterium]|nr:cation transporter [Bacillota bacterium]